MSTLEKLIAMRRALKTLSDDWGRIVFYNADGHPILDTADIQEDGWMRSSVNIERPIFPEKGLRP